MNANSLLIRNPLNNRFGNSGIRWESATIFMSSAEHRGRANFSNCATGHQMHIYSPDLLLETPGITQNSSDMFKRTEFEQV